MNKDRLIVPQGFVFHIEGTEENIYAEELTLPDSAQPTVEVLFSAPVLLENFPGPIITGAKNAVARALKEKDETGDYIAVRSLVDLLNMTDDEIRRVSNHLGEKRLHIYHQATYPLREALGAVSVST